ncbi:hypothetical protein PIB30_022956 [Stylosanthes scabra]|uniref:Uncharacterized protein n=1 Tax=Stylosanthes scabra TaxID=79078 RepID=A0ABU6S950_9FABA|nr:hypothetical protein [Stylosanthes scabra]
MAACKFLLSLPAGLPKKNDFSCRWILDHNDTEVAQFLDGLLEVKMKQNRLDKLRAQLVDTSGMGPHSILPIAIPPNNPSATPSATAGTSSSADATASPKVTQPSSLVTTHSQKKVSPGTICLDTEEGVKEDPSTDLRRKRQKRKQDDVDLIDRVLGEDSAWAHDVHPVDLAFPNNFDYRKAIDGGVASSSVRRSLVKIPPEQLLGESYRFNTKALACLQEGERQSALDRVAQLEEDNKVLTAQLASCQLSLEKEQKKVEVAEKDVKALNTSLAERQTALGTANASAEFWEAEWKKLGEETLDMCQETLEIVLDQISHFCHGVDFSMITLDTRWDQKGRRIYNRKETSGEDSEMVEELPHVDAVSQEQQPEVTEHIQQPEVGNVAGEGGECPT